MKKSTIVASAAFAFTLLLSSNVQAQKFPDLDKSPMDVASFPNEYKVPEKAVKITYSRPQLKGRSMNELAPAGKVWRTGANEADEITFYKDVKLGATAIKAGTYTFYTIPGENSYTVIINKDLNVWGAYSYNQEKDVARMTVPVSKADEVLESLAMVFTKSDKGMDLNIGWDKTRVVVPFTE